ncbi:hypothetical protein ACFL6C_06105 [Myxococcota bacterium]
MASNVDTHLLSIIGVFVGVFFFIFMGVALMIKKFYRKVEQGEALVVNKIGSTTVSFTGGLVLPIIHRAETMDISLKTIEIDRRGKEGLICADNIRGDIKVTFFVRVNKTPEDVLKVAQSVGCTRASKQDTVEELFNAKFSEALKTVGYNMEFVSLYNKRDDFKDRIIQVIGTDLNGYSLEDAAIDFLEQTPLDSLDPDNILDANGIRKITQLTTEQHVLTNEKENWEKQEITRQDVTARERILDLERQQAEAEAKQQREVQTIQAEAQAEIDVKKAEEDARAQRSRISADEAIALEDEERKRKVAVAEKNRERVVAVEQERVLKDRNLEAIGRQREEQLTLINKDKELEVEKKAIADVIRERIAVEKTVAEEEERIKDLRAIAGADRTKKTTIITAEGQAEEALVKDIKAAEARERSATHLARERIITADADLDASEKETRARVRRSEGVQAETAAPGLGEVRVREADATAIEKVGMAEVRVKEADATAIEKVGLAEAKVLQEKMEAEAQGIEQQGMAKVHVDEAGATAIEKRGLAEATAVKEKLGAEANGLSEKATAMKALDEASRGHEEFRIQLEKDEKIDRASIEANRQVAEAQARVLAEAFKHTKIDIVGGDGEFFEKFINAVSWGKSIDGFVDKSDRAQKVLKGYLDGEASLPADLKEVFSRPALGSQDVQRLTISALLGTLLKRGDKGQKASLEELLKKAKELGVDKLPLA